MPEPLAAIAARLHNDLGALRDHVALSPDLAQHIAVLEILGGPGNNHVAGQLASIIDAIDTALMLQDDNEQIAQAGELLQGVDSALTDRVAGTDGIERALILLKSVDGNTETPDARS